MISGFVKRMLHAQSFFGSVLNLASATAAGQLIVLLSTPLLTRFYDPGDFGTFAVFWAYLSVIVVVSSLRYEMAIPLPERTTSAKHLLVVSLGINAMAALLCFGLVFILGERIAAWTGTPGLELCIWWIPGGILCVGSYKAFNYWAVRNEDYRRIAKTRLTQSGTNVSVQIGGGILGAGVLGMVLGQLAGQTVGITTLARGIGLRTFCFGPLFSLGRMRLLLKRYRRFPLYDAPAAVLNMLASQVPHILMAPLFGPAVAGFYLLTERVLGMPAGLLGQSIGQVLYGSMHNAMRDKTLHRLICRIAATLGAIAFLPALALLFAGEELFSWVFGPVWREAGLYASWMIWGVWVQLVYSPISMVLMATDGQAVNFLLQIFMFFLKIFAIFYGYHRESALIAVIGFSLAAMLGYGMGVLVVILRTRQYRTENKI